MEGLPGDPTEHRGGRVGAHGLSAEAHRLALPQWRREPDDAERVVRDIDAWSSSGALAELVGATGGPASALCGADRLDELARFSSRWDVRAGLERDQAQARAHRPELERLVAECAPVLGQADRSAPVSDRYDAVVMTGGMVRAEIVKPRFVRVLLDGGLACDEVVFLGGFRPFSTDEQRLAGLLGIRSDDEFDAMGEGLERAFGPLGAERSAGGGERDRTGWRESGWAAGGLTFSVIAAPSSDPRSRRANTADTFRFWARRAQHVRKVLVVTTPVYVPYQAAIAVQTLGVEHAIAVETVGVTASASFLGYLTQPFTAQHHLQELRSAILAMRSLRAALAGGAARGTATAVARASPP